MGGPNGVVSRFSDASIGQISPGRVEFCLEISIVLIWERRGGSLVELGGVLLHERGVDLDLGRRKRGAANALFQRPCTVT